MIENHSLVSEVVVSLLSGKRDSLVVVKPVMAEDSLSDVVVSDTEDSLLVEERGRLVEVVSKASLDSVEGATDEERIP